MPRRKKEKPGIKSGIALQLEAERLLEECQIDFERIYRDIVVFGEAKIFVDDPGKSDIITEVEEKPVFNSTAESWGFEE